MSGSKAIPLEGQLSSVHGDFDLPELIFAVSETGKTGRLVLHGGDVEKNLFLTDGQVVFAASSSPDDRLGTYLLQRDELALEDLSRLSRLVRPGVRLGSLLVEHGLLPLGAVERAVQGHVHAIVMSLFGLTRGAYAFLEEPGLSDEPIFLSTPTPRLIVDGVESVVSWTRIIRGLGSLNQRFGIVGGNAASLRSADLDTSSLELLAMLRHPKSIEETCAASELPDITVCRKLWAFRVLDWIRPVDEVSELDLDPEGLGLIFGGNDGH